MKAFAHAVLAGFGLLAAAAGPASSQTYPVTITNNCGYPIHVLGTPQSSAVPYSPLASGHSTVYNLTPPWPGGRVYGCWNDVTGYFDDVPTLTHNCAWVELTLGADGNVFSNISYVDYISIPIKIQASSGTACVPANATVATSFDETTVQQTCPTKLAPSLSSPANDKACMSAFHLCVDADGRPGDASCTLLDPIIATCVDTPATYPGCAAGTGTTTPDVYGCRPTTFWSTTQGEAFCMAMNRGILPSFADQSDPSTFYPTGGTFNAYGAFVHGLPGAGPVFALSYDDYPPTLNQGGYVNCQSSASYSITFCNSATKARRVAAKGVVTSAAQRPSRDRVMVSGSFASAEPIDLAREKVVLESVLEESPGAGELVSGLGHGSSTLPVTLFRLPGAGPDAAIFETGDDVTPRARLRIARGRANRYDFSLSVRGISIQPAGACGASDRAVLASRFTLDTAALEVVNEEAWSCAGGTTYPPGH